MDNIIVIADSFIAKKRINSNVWPQLKYFITVKRNYV